MLLSGAAIFIVDGVGSDTVDTGKEKLGLSEVIVTQKEHTRFPSLGCGTLPTFGIAGWSRRIWRLGVREGPVIIAEAKEVRARHIGLRCQ